MGRSGCLDDGRGVTGGRHADLCLALAAMIEVRTVHVVDDSVTLVPTELGWDRIARQGKAATVADLRRRLAQVGARAVPGTWRFVTRLPRATPRPPMQPCWNCLAADDVTWQGEAVVGDDLAVLQGHFPGEPIVPGVAQLFWAATLARRAFPACGHRLTGEVRDLKFKRAILPRVRLRVSLTFEDVDALGAPRHVAFGYQSDSVHSHGRLLLDR